MQKDMLPFVLQKLGYYSSILAFPALVLGTCVNLQTASSIKAEADKTYVRPPVVFVYEDGSVEVWEQGKTTGSERQLRKYVEGRGRKVAEALFANPMDEAVVKTKAADLHAMFSKTALTTFKEEVSKSVTTAIRSPTEYVKERESIQYIKSHDAWTYIAYGTMIATVRGANQSKRVSLKLGFGLPSDSEAKENPDQVLVVREMEVTRETI
jgi:hypothetical protein